MKWCYLHIAFFLMLLPLTMKAQQFVVESFRTLPNDLTAFHTPVYDLNHDACALLKVVCSSDYVFDSLKNELPVATTYTCVGSTLPIQLSSIAEYAGIDFRKDDSWLSKLHQWFRGK